MALIPVQDSSLAGLVDTPAAAAAGDQFVNNGLILLHVTNGGGSSITVTVDDVGTTVPEGATSFNPDVVVTIAAGASKFIGPFPPFRFNDGSGRVSVSYSSLTSVTRSIIRVRSR